MSFRCQIYQKRLTFNNVFAKNCDVRLIILCLIATTTILPIIKCAKLENPQIRLLINDDDLLQEKSNIHEAGGTANHDNSGEHFNLYRSELKRLSYETIHRILRDENEPSYRREETELRYYQKRSPTYEETHQLIKRAAVTENDLCANFSKKNLTKFVLNPVIEKELKSASSLDLSDNYLSFLNLSLVDKYSQLSLLNLKNNSFISIPLSQQSTIKSLNLNHNLIQTSQLSSNIYLRNLYLSSNRIEQLNSIKLSLLKNLESLDISHNLLKTTETSFFTERMHNLKHLNLANNQLGSIYRETFYNLLSLNTLLLSHNNITDIDYETFLALPNLQYLDLSFNRLRGKSIRALQGITGLVALNIAFNPEIGAYMQEFVASWSLKELDASGTGLCQIPAALAQSVRSLKLTHNWLKVINCGDLDSYPLLQYLDLSNSHIEHIEDDAIGRLEILEILMLDHNQLKKIPFSLPVSLEHLFLQNNDIMEIPQQAFQGLNNLKTLDLSHNKLMYLPDLTLPKLITLNLQSAEIKGINQGIVHTLPKLTDLMLEDNPIKCSDLLGIAEWASTCRLRAGKEEEGEEGDIGGVEDVSNDEEVINIIDLRKKFEKMHNFYEKFEMDGNSTEDDFLMLEVKKPNCVKESLKLFIAADKDTNHDVQVAAKSFNLLNSPLMQKEPSMLQENLFEETTKTTKLENFNQNSMISLTAATTDLKTLMEYNKTDANLKNAVKQKLEKVEVEDAKITTTTIQEPTQAETTASTTSSLPAATSSTTSSSSEMQSSIINEKQTFKTTTKTFNNALATTTTPSTIIQTTNVAPQNQQQQQHQQQQPETTREDEKEFFVKPRFINEMKTFDHLTTTAVAAAATTFTTSISPTTTTSAVKDEIASIGNTQTQSFENMTEVVKVATKRGEDVVKITSKTLQNPQQLKIRNAQDIQKENVEHLENLSKEAKDMRTTTTTAALQEQQKLTAINLKEQQQQPEIAMKTTTNTTTTISNTMENEQTTLKPQINLLKDKQQHLQQRQHEIKTKIATTKEIKSLTTETTARTIENPSTTIKTTIKTTILNGSTKVPTSGIVEIIKLQSPSETTAAANLDNKSNKELKEFTFTSKNTNSKQNNGENPITARKTTPQQLQTLATTTSSPIAINKEDIMPTTTISSTTAAATTAIILKTSTIEVPAAAVGAASTAVKDKDLASNYNDNDKNTTNNNTNTTNNIINNKTKDLLNITTTTTPSSLTTKNLKHPTDNTLNNDQHHHQQHLLQQHHHQHQEQHLKDEKNVILYHHQSQQKMHVNVKCMQSNSNECNSTIPQRQQDEDEIGKQPTNNQAAMTTTIEETKAAAVATTAAEATTIAVATTPATLLQVIHKHEPLQLLVKDRHLIGTPLLMHKGENLMVTADELILPTIGREDEEKDNNKEEEEKKLSNKGQHVIEATTVIDNTKNSKYILDKSQQQQQQQQFYTTTAEPKNIQNLNDKKGQKDTKDIKTDEQHLEEFNKLKKSSLDMKTKKPSLIMKKMTIITKQHHEQDNNYQHTPLEPKENEVHQRNFDNTHYQELKPIIPKEPQNNQLHSLKHTTVNTPINKEANLLKEPHTFQHEHEMLIQQILQDQQAAAAETHEKFSKTEQWSELRKAENKENHPGLILLVSSGLFLVLLLGLMHVYRCDMPWKRNSPVHHLRPHQRHNGSLEDDSHSFLSYHEGMHKWHHSTRLEAPYNSPLHHLHVRELQKTSATEKPTTVKSAATNFKTPMTRSSLLTTTRSMSQSSTTTTSTASPSSSAILDDETFYIEMTPDSGQMAQALQSELLPMELLNMAQSPLNYNRETIVDIQTSMEDYNEDDNESQQHHYHPHPHLHQKYVQSTSSTALPSSSTTALPSSVSPSSSFNVKSQANSRKFGLW